MASRVLLIENDLDLATVVGELLEDAGFEVVLAPTPTHGATALDGGEVDLVVCDFYGGVADASWAALARLRDAAAPRPVGIMTGWPVTPTEAQRRGFAFVLAKPCAGEALLAEVGAHARVPPVAPTTVEVIRAYFAALERGDWAGLGALCTADVVYHVPGDHRLSRTVRGRRAFEAFAAETFRDFHEPRFEVDEVTPLPSGALARYRGRWAGGEAEGAVVFGLSGGAIASIGIRVDLAAISA